jgi:mono/diheme cytochrome c family protein
MSPRRFRAVAAVWGPPLLVGAIAFGCGGTASRSVTATRATTPTTAAATTTRVPDVHVTAASFRNLKTMTPIRGFFVANLLGNLRATLAVARSLNGGVYPTGTLLQLLPTEAMVKHRPGWNPATDDWEFFALRVSASGTEILTHGVQNVVNRFGGNCAACHSAAKAKFDFVCEHDHGCAPLPVSDAIIKAIQLADPRRA